VADPWSFWRDQLNGYEPPTSPGKPHAGFFLLRERKRTPVEKQEIGGSRWNVKTNHWPCAIWQDDDGWHCVITKQEATSHLTDLSAIDEGIFSRCCRAAIRHDDYLTRVAEIKGARINEPSND
jgi:hypothetical protein